MHEKIADWNVKMPSGKVVDGQGAAGFLASRQVDNSFIAVNRLLKEGMLVSATTAPVTLSGRTYPTGTFSRRAGRKARQVVQSAALDLGVTFNGVNTAPNGAVRVSRPTRGTVGPAGRFDRRRVGALDS